MASKRVLIIESEDDFAQTLESMFSRFDAEVQVIADGKQGLQTAKTEPPDLILLCVELPKMSGYSICNKLKKDKKLKSVPLIIMSSEATEETFEQHKKLKTRAEDYIIKPFDPDAILEKISALVELPEAEPLGDEELITIDEDETITIDEDDAEVIELPDLDDENLDLAEDDSTVVMESPLDGSPGDTDDLESFDDVFDELKMDEEDDAAGAEEGDPATDDAILGGADELEGFEDVLDSLKEVEEETDEDAGSEEEDAVLSEFDEPGIGSEPAPDEEAIPLDFETAPEAADEPVVDLEPPELEPPPELVPPPLEPPPLEPPEPEVAEEAAPIGFESPPDLKPPPAAPRQKEEGGKAKPDPVLMTRLQNAEEENGILREKVAALEAKLEEMHQSFEKRESELGSLRSRTTSKDKEFLALKATINAKDREILDLKEESNKKDQEVLDVQEKMAERQAELSRMQESLAGRDREIKEQSDRADALLRQKNDLEEELQAKMAEWDDRYTTDTAKLEHAIQVMKEEQARALQDAEEKLRAAEDATKRLRTDFDDTKQRHNDEVFGLRTRYKNEIEKLEGERNNLRSDLEQTQQELEDERAGHEETRQQASRIPGLEEDLESTRATVSNLEQQIADLKQDLAENEERVVKAYQRIKNDEKVKEKARKAVEIAFTLLADQVSEDGQGDADEITIDPDEAHT